MKLLIRDCNQNLVWREAIYKDGAFHLLNNDKMCDITEIYAVKDDNRCKTVICSYCGKEVRNTPSAIKAHRDMINKPNKCFECSYLRRRNEKVHSQKYTLNDDGTYTESTKRTVQLTCYRNYSWSDINGSEARKQCKYADCENAEFRHIEDFWTKYPNAFDEFITVDRIIEAGYKSMHKYTDSIEFVLKGRGNLVANVNNQGICIGFTLSYSSHTYTLRYSKKYDKVWVLRYGFKDLSTLNLAADTEEAIIKKLRNLYM